MVEKRVSRKELLKESDEFLTATGTVVKFATEHRREVTIACIALFVAIMAVSGYFTYRHYQQAQSFRLLDQALNDYHDIERSGAPASSDKLDGLLARFETIVQDYGSFPAGEMALLYTGHLLYAKNDHKAALDRYEKMQNTVLARTGLGPLVLYHIAMTRFALKDYDQASALFTQLSKDTGSPYRREAYAAIARIYEAMGKNKEAAQAYKQYLKMFPEAPDAAFIKSRLAELSAVG